MAEHLPSEFELYMLTRNHDKDPNQPYTSVPTGQWHDAFGWTIKYLAEDRLARETIAEAIAEIQPDVLYLNSYFSKFTRVAIRCLALPGPAHRSKFAVLLAPRGELIPSALRQKRLKKSAYVHFDQLMKVTERSVDAWQATSEAELQQIKTCFPSASVHLVPNLPQPELPTPPVQRVRRPGYPGPTRILFLGRIAPVKNLEVVVQAIAAAHCQTVLHLVGHIDDHRYWKKIRRLAAESGVPFQHTPSVDSTLTQSLIEGSDMLFQPSLSENFGHSILESLVLGCPVATSDQTPWLPLNFLGGGIALDPQDVHGFAAFIDDLHTMPCEQYQATSMAAKEAASQLSSSEETAAAAIELFEMLKATFSVSGNAI